MDWIRKDSLILPLMGVLCVITACGRNSEQQSAFSQSKAVGVRSFPVVNDGVYNHNHSSNILELSDGRLLASWFVGTEASNETKLVFAELAPGAAAWSKPRVVLRRGSYKAIGNASLLLDDEGYLWMFYQVIAIGGHSGSYVNFRVSDDFGHTWGSERRLAGGFLDYGHLPRNQPIKLDDGTFMVPVYREFTSKYSYVFLIKSKQGEIVKKSEHRIPQTDHIQPTLVRTQIPDQDFVYAWLRNYSDTAADRRVLFSKFHLKKRQWSKPVQTNLPNPNAAVAATITADGKYLLAYNHSATARSPLSLAISSDGVNFKKIYDIETEPGNFSYPSLLRASDGTYHMTYTHNKRLRIQYFSFDERWLQQQLAP